MNLIILECVPYHLLNHMHDIRSKTTTLEGPLSNTPDLTLDKIEYAKGLCIWCHPMKQIPRVIYYSALVSTLTVNSLPESPV